MHEPPLAPSITQGAIDMPMATRRSSMEQMEQQEYVTTNHVPYGHMTIASLLNAHIATINSERQALWLRFTAMLLANALLYGFFLQLQAPTTLQVVFAAGFGWALCMTWLILTISGFHLLILQLEAAGAFAKLHLAAISKYANPVNIELDTEPFLMGIEWRRSRRNRWQSLTMVFIIVLFMLAYAFWLIHHIYYIFIFVEGPR
jgi:hypothetical protein